MKDQLQPDFHYTSQGRMLGLCFGALALVGSLGVLGACDEESASFKRRNNPAEDPTAPKCTDTGSSYSGFDGKKLEEKRVNGVAGADRARLKPYSALKGEYTRVLGAAPDSLEQAAPSFGNPPARFSSEPRASAIQVYSAYRVGFDACLTYTESKAAFSAAPTMDSAKQECGSMARTFWSRAATAEEVEQCAQVAVTDSASESAPKRRWAYTCASLLATSGFLTY